MKPVASRERLLVRELAGELVVYDLERHEAHCLNRTAALVFLHSNGRNRVEEIAARLRDELRQPADEELVRLALDRLRQAGLVAPEAAAPVETGGFSRRDTLPRLGMGLAVLLPAVTSILVPTPAEAAATCVPATACGANPDAPCYRTTAAGCGGGCTCQGATCSSGCCDGAGGDCSY